MGSNGMAVFVGWLLAAGPARRDRGGVDGRGVVNRAGGGTVWEIGRSRVKHEH